MLRGPFKDRAEKPLITRSPEQKLEMLAQLMRDVRLKEAAAAKDWTQIDALIKDGANLKSQRGAAIQSLIEDAGIAALRLLETLPIADRIDALGDALSSAAKQGLRRSVDELLAREKDAFFIAAAFIAAVTHRQNDIADLLFPRLKPRDLGDDEMLALLFHRPDLYKEALAQGLSAREDPLGFFITTCSVKDIPAAKDALADLQQAMKHDTTEFNYNRFGFYDHLFNVIKTADTDLINATFKAFPLPEEYHYHFFHEILKNDDPRLFDYYTDLLKPEEHIIGAALAMCHEEALTNTLPLLIDKYPEALRENSALPLEALIKRNDVQEFSSLVASGKIPLPVAEDRLLDLLKTALEAKNTTAVTLLDPLVSLTPDIVQNLKNSSQPDILLFVAQKTGDWHFDDDCLFWAAVENGRMDIVDLLPRRRGLSSESAYVVDSALDSLSETADNAIVEKVIACVDWTSDALETAVYQFLGRPDMLQKFLDLGAKAEPLNDNDVRFLAKDGANADTLAFLEKKGFIFNDETRLLGLEEAVKNKNAAMFGHLAARADLEKEFENLLPDLHEDANLGILETLARHIATARKTTDPALAEDIRAADAKDLLGNFAVRAAYADGFSLIMAKIVETKTAPKAEDLLKIKDEYGNGLLDILGRHGKLNDVLKAEAWPDEDIIEFLHAQARPEYLPQCDFAGFSAAQSRLRINAAAKKGNFKLKPKAP